MPPSQPGLQRLAGAELRARTIKNFKEVSQWRHNIESQVESLKLLLKDESQRWDEKAGNLDSL
jgi:hypothetical protein